MRIFELETQIQSLIEYVSKGAKKSDKENIPCKISVKIRKGRNMETTHSKSMKTEDHLVKLPPRDHSKPKKSESKKKKKSSKSRSKSKTIADIV